MTNILNPTRHDFSYPIPELGVQAVFFCSVYENESKHHIVMGMVCCNDTTRNTVRTCTVDGERFYSLGRMSSNEFVGQRIIFEPRQNYTRLVERFSGMIHSSMRGRLFDISEIAGFKDGVHLEHLATLAYGPEPKAIAVTVMPVLSDYLIVVNFDHFTIYRAFSHKFAGRSDTTEALLKFSSLVHRTWYPSLTSQSPNDLIQLTLINRRLGELLDLYGLETLEAATAKLHMYVAEITDVYRFGFGPRLERYKLDDTPTDWINCDVQKLIQQYF